MNSINLTGNICNDVELKKTTSGKSVVSFNLAVNRPFTKDTTDFIPIVVWNQPAEYLSRYAHKGTRIAVTGKLTTRSYEDKEGKKRTVYEVVADSAEICDSKSDGQALVTPTEPAFQTPATPKFEEVEADEDLPF